MARKSHRVDHRSQRAAPGGSDTRPTLDLSEVAAETPAESIARENEIVEELARDDSYADQPAEHSVEEQLEGLEDAGEIRRMG